MKTVAIIVAAGKGLRAGGEIPKQYQTFKCNRMLTYSINAFLGSLKIDGLLVVINPSDLKLYEDSIKNISDDRLLNYCFGGTERSNSVEMGLNYLKKYSPQKVLIHDAARPFVSTELINNLIESLKSKKAVIPIVPIVDAVWQKTQSFEKNSSIEPGPNRENLCLAQTPQAFDFKSICIAYEKYSSSAFDDSSIVYASGIDIQTIKGSNKNRKITSKEDLIAFKGIK